MTEFAESPALIIVAILVLLVGSLLVLAWGRRIPRQADWIVGLGLVALLVAVGIGWSLLADQNFAPTPWARGWIGPREENGAITVGVLRDALALGMGMLAALVAATALVGACAQFDAPRAGRYYASLGISAAGVAVAWSALTPWFALMGCAVTVFGGFLALGGLWDEGPEALLASRFGWERSWGLILAVLGLCVLAGGRAPLSMLSQASEGPWNPIGAGLLFIGAFTHLQPFPLLGWVMSRSRSYCPARVVIAQVFPAWAILALLLRLEPQLRASGVFPDLGWLGLASAVLAAVSGLLGAEWRQSLGAWISTGFSLGVAALAFAGPVPALCVVIGLGLGASALSGFASALEEGGPASNTGRKRALWAKAGCAAAAAAGTGCFGFVAAGSMRAISLTWQQPAVTGALGVVFFLFTFVGWKVAWQASAIKNNTQASWAAVLSPYFLLVLALGVLWTGTLSGGVIPGNPDRLFQSPIGIMISAISGAAGELWGADASIAPSCALYWALWAIAAGTAFWTVGKKPDLWPGVTRALPRFSAFVISGYGVDTLVSRLREGLSWGGRVSFRVIDRGVWQAWVPVYLGRGVRAVSGVIAAADLKLSRGIGSMLKKWVETPSKALQLIQSGDVQWYLFFAVGSGIAILAHFMIKS